VNIPIDPFCLVNYLILIGQIDLLPVLFEKVVLPTAVWGIGKEILSRQTEEGWGTKVVERLPHDLHVEFPT
jgi:hypothetical protein